MVGKRPGDGPPLTRVAVTAPFAEREAVKTLGWQVIRRKQLLQPIHQEDAGIDKVFGKKELAPQHARAPQSHYRPVHQARTGR